MQEDKRQYYSVRGKLTYDKLNLTSNIASGDPGLLLSRFYKPKTTKQFNICLIVHYVDYFWFVDNYNNTYKIINIAVNDIETLADEINQCYFVFSSSLHGIIFSHSLGVPAVHIENYKLTSKITLNLKIIFPFWIYLTQS